MRMLKNVAFWIPRSESKWGKMSPFFQFAHVGQYIICGAWMLIDHRTIFLGCSKMNVEEKFTALPIELQMKVVTHYVPLLEENCHHYLRARQTNRFWNKAICDNLQHHRCMRLPHIFKDSCFSFYRLLCTKPYETRKKKFGPPLGPLLKIGEILVFWTCLTQNVIWKKNPWNPVSFIPKLTT